jgi:hypothetical protein
MVYKILGAFVLGFLFCALLFGFSSEVEFPFPTGFVVFDEDVSAPSDYVGEEDIIVLSDRVILKVDGVTLSSYADSGSMVPVLDEGANGIRVVPASESEVGVGDIVSFRPSAGMTLVSPMSGRLVVHRVVEKGWDEEGVWFVVKGDANLVGDGRIRFEDIEYLTVGIIY